MTTVISTVFYNTPGNNFFPFYATNEVNPTPSGNNTWLFFIVCHAYLIQNLCNTELQLSRVIGVIGPHRLPWQCQEWSLYTLGLEGEYGHYTSSWLLYPVQYRSFVTWSCSGRRKYDSSWCKYYRPPLFLLRFNRSSWINASQFLKIYLLFNFQTLKWLFWQFVQFYLFFYKERVYQAPVQPFWYILVYFNTSTFKVCKRWQNGFGDL